MTAYLMVALGSAIGGVLRHFITIYVNARTGEVFPWATLIINIIGSIIIGIAASLLRHEQARQFIMIGICGGFTTFSAFSLQSVLLIQNGQWILAGSYILLSVMLCIFGTGLGFWLTENLVRL